MGSDNGLSPIRRQAIISTNAGLFSIGPLGTNFSEILIKIQNFSITKIHLKISSAKMSAILSRGRWVNCQFGLLCFQKSRSSTVRVPWNYWMRARTSMWRVKVCVTPGSCPSVQKTSKWELGEWTTDCFLIDLKILCLLDIFLAWFLLWLDKICQQSI